MEMTLYIVGIVFITYCAFKLYSTSGKKQITATRPSYLESEENNIPIKKKSTFEIPDTLDGYMTYEFEDDDEFFVHGVQYRKKAVLEWAQGDNHKLHARREPSNKYDSNAIAIQGESSGKKRKIGYIATEIAEDLVDKGLDRKLKFQLLNVKITDDVNPDSEFDMSILIKYKILIPLK